MSSPVLTAPPLPVSDAPPPRAEGRSLTWLAAIPIGLHAVLAWILRAPTIATGNDDAVYLLLARALREGHYRELFYVGTPIHAQYPPAYPALLALLGAPEDGGIGIAIAANILMSCAALALLFDLMRRWSLPLGLVAVAVLAVNPSLLGAAGHVQSEPMFMAAVMLALWALRPSANPKHRWIAIAAVVVAALTRSAGVAVIAGVFVHFVLLRSWRHAAWLALVSLLTVGPWLTVTAMAPQKIAGRSYIADAFLTLPPPDSTVAVVGRRPPRTFQEPPQIVRLGRSLVTRLRLNVPRYATRALPSQLAIPTIEGTIVDNLAWLLLMLSALAVGFVSAWRRWRAAVLVLVTYGALLLLWPYTVSRFLTPILPVIVALLLLGAWRVGARLLPRMALAPALVLAAIPLAGGAQAVGATIAQRGACPPSEQETDGSCAADALRYRSLVESLRARLPEDAKVLTSKEGTFFYRTGRQVVSLYPALGLSADDLTQYLREGGAQMIFLPHLKPEEVLLGPPLAELCSTLTDAESPTDDMLVLWTRPPGPDESNACGAVERWRATW